MTASRKFSTKNADKLQALARADMQAALQAAKPKSVYLGTKVQVAAVSPVIEKRLLDWIRHMRGAKFFCITTECLRYALAYFNPEYVESRSRDAVKMYIFGFYVVIDSRTEGSRTVAASHDLICR
ncbi:hypothetical protein PC116_g18333 [Phytophthora cactorum]|uniref:Uncharacterized protein n=1 Tax=Phytophthora cactorum TaxID=29920 RepID=A0A8T1KE47_9STRA|nr:hypothetical protein PC117_g21366 [Phytophthora cactorum]KAG3189189.1 hypothetical protein PC128_g11900 [Phytophthora cactorum]KAG4233465.1 hypothetical protein PC116_g18333 [Phytophthora cactorum]